MSGVKKVIFLFLTFVALFEATQARCPSCVYKTNDTYTDYAMRMLKAKGPATGSCDGTVKYTHFGKDFGLSNNACCCLSIAPAVNLTDLQTCPDNLGIRKNEPIWQYYIRFGKAYPNAPENGICRTGTYKFIFIKALTGLSRDICGCVPDNKAFID